MFLSPFTKSSPPRPRPSPKCMEKTEQIFDDLCHLDRNIALHRFLSIYPVAPIVIPCSSSPPHHRCTLPLFIILHLFFSVFKFNLAKRFKIFEKVFDRGMRFEFGERRQLDLERIGLFVFYSRIGIKARLPPTKWLA